MRLSSVIAAARMFKTRSFLRQNCGVRCADSILLRPPAMFHGGMRRGVLRRPFHPAQAYFNLRYCCPRRPFPALLNATARHGALPRAQAL